jgi:hypothetical protein
MNMRRLHVHFHRRRGSTYILVIFASLMVAAIGLATLNLDRVQGQAGADGDDFIEARSYARAGVEIGMLMIRNDPYWRTDLGNAPWVTNKAIGAGAFSLSATNPVSGDVTVGNNDPVILTSTGMKGRAKYMKSVRLEVGPPVGSCFEVSMISGASLSINGATLTGNQTIAADQNVSSNNGSVVNSNVEASGMVNGWGYTKATASRVPVRTMPDPVNSFTYYLANGTTINNTSLPLAQSLQFLTNTTFATNTSGWYAVGNSVLSVSTSQSQSGTTSLLVSNRILSTDTVAQDLSPASLSRLAAASGNQFSIRLPIYSATQCTAQAVLTLVTAASGTLTFATNPVNVNASQWTSVSGSLTPSFSGTLTKATVSVTVSGTGNFFMDNVSLTDQSYPYNVYVIDRALLSPTSNPYGSGQTNAQGIYVIQCANQTVQISNSRIVGTLVFVNPGNNSGIVGPVVWEPAVYNYPVLMAAISGGGQFNIAPTSGALSEASLGVNLNPPGTPYPYVGGTANSTMTDSYPAQINGLIYSSANLTLYNSPSIFGTVIANSTISVTAPPGNQGVTSINLSYGNVYLNNPPPGFTGGTISMKEVYGTWQRVVQ